MSCRRLGRASEVVALQIGGSWQLLCGSNWEPEVDQDWTFSHFKFVTLDGSYLHSC